MKSGIYTITNLINDKVYIGFTKDFLKRRVSHWNYLRAGNHPNYHLQNAVNQYGIENFEFEVLEECEERFLFSQEHYWALLLNTTNNKFGYNIKPTHPYGLNMTSYEMRENMRINRKGKAIGRKSWNKGTILSESSRKKLSDSHKGIKLSNSHKRNISIAGRNRYRRPFFCFKNGRFLGEFNTKVEAAEFLGLKNRSAKGNILAVLNGVYSQTHGYTFKYKEVI